MKWFIELLLLCFIGLSSKKIQANNFDTIAVYYGSEQRQEAHWVHHLLVKSGIPEDFIKLKRDHYNCTRPQRNGSLLILCVDQSSALKLLKFEREAFFWQMKPLMEQD